jgi:hypothetical protein
MACKLMHVTIPKQPKLDTIFEKPCFELKRTLFRISNRMNLQLLPLLLQLFPINFIIIIKKRRNVLKKDLEND